MTAPKPTNPSWIDCPPDFRRRISSTPLWTQRDDLMPMTPSPRAVPFVWKW